MLSLYLVTRVRLIYLYLCLSRHTAVHPGTTTRYHARRWRCAARWPVPARRGGPESRVPRDARARGVAGARWVARLGRSRARDEA